ncbi:DDE-type integrase/transposase/recombinase [Streptomyces sp. NBC_01214]|uniref:DDE-type integrase/transposase/recombinase n=1 Tax=Streptomyces sp. NBC_01214 TaxID=2903777 RepID=UPI00224C98A1|nr:DDE-type integrase/transposase/recombinase [Streptomyces sp. NBC_01214]MCX4807352.1 DDE-type integrase/transposase/recombinase [Streptomyces sp. NBC_01214]
MKAPDLTGRDFTADTVNTKCVGDITRIPLTSGKLLYLATVIGLASSRLVGWALVDRMRAELVTDALAVARRCRGSLCNAGTPITDHGTQCTSTARRRCVLGQRSPITCETALETPSTTLAPAA